MDKDHLWAEQASVSCKIAVFFFWDAIFRIQRCKITQTKGESGIFRHPQAVLLDTVPIPSSPLPVPQMKRVETKALTFLFRCILFLQISCPSVIYPAPDKNGIESMSIHNTRRCPPILCLSLALQRGATQHDITQQIRLSPLDAVRPAKKCFVQEVYRMISW